ncbi:hypothetical protein NO2_1034 [Candidatus Termititenax persephonae]|uniref:Uncharacterized protein n=1 Tax=Candidatus Termititenax persephonae TaxID=2218525 RepID=A0A388TH94_9BACT|nr:hypothetical protein NO2_1034 [Candidatus Termititenax persephonae]
MGLARLSTILDKYEQKFCELCSPKALCTVTISNKPKDRLINFDKVKNSYFSYTSRKPKSCDGLKINNALLFFELKQDVYFKNHSLLDLHTEFSNKINESVEVLLKVFQTENFNQQEIAKIKSIGEIKYYIVPNMVSPAKKLSIRTSIIKFTNSYSTNQNYRALYGTQKGFTTKLFVRNCNNLGNIS